MARQGYSRVVPLACLTGLAFLWLPGNWRWLVGGALAVLLVLLLNFYRDPDRTAPAGTGGALRLLAPADGRVVAVRHSQERLEVSIFLSAFDVHVNRSPAAGRVVSLAHTPGRYLPAFLANSSTENERVRLEIQSPDAGRVVCTQVAGLLARRIENWIEVGSTLAEGERYGMIHLGSRLDLEAPGEFKAVVAPGQRVKAGVSVLAEYTRG